MRGNNFGTSLSPPVLHTDFITPTTALPQRWCTIAVLLNTTVYYFLSGKFETAVPTKHISLSLSRIVAIWYST